MDSAVSLVQAYLRVNGYLTVTEMPVFRSFQGGGFGAATDIDVLAFRFPGAGRPLLGKSQEFAPDPEIGCPPHQADMLIGEVKEGKAEFNAAALDPKVIAAVLARFGCCKPNEAAKTAHDLVRKGRTETPHGHCARLVAFGSQINTGHRTRYHRIALGHVLQFLKNHLAKQWKIFGNAQLKDPVLGIMLTMEKARRGISSKNRDHGRGLVEGTKS